MDELLRSIIGDNRHIVKKGKVATYIPELSTKNRDALGICVYTLDYNEYSAGDCETRFTMQSISKIIMLMMAIQDNGAENMFKKVGIETTAASFNSIVDLETHDTNKPLNPMINSGAIATTSLVGGSSYDEKFQRLLGLTREITSNPSIDVDMDVYHSEKDTGDRNRALAYYMKSTGIIEGDVEKILDIYFKMCSLEVMCTDIAKIGATLANDGVMPWNGERAVSKDAARITKSIMATCGMYDASGEFAVNVGIPGKSGVGGGILAVVPHKMGIGVIGPSLDEKGNSIGGMAVLSQLSKVLNLSIY